MSQKKQASKLRKQMHTDASSNSIQNMRQTIYDMYEANEAPLTEKTPQSWTPFVEAAAIAIVNSHEEMGKELLLDMKYTKDAFSINEDDYDNITKTLDELQENDINNENLEEFLTDRLRKTQLCKINIR